MMSSRLVLPPSGANPAGPSKGTVALRDAHPGLEQALVVFQANLTDEERTRLQRMKGSSCDADAVLRFTHDLDGVNPARRGKSIATRLYSLIQTAQQFYQVPDTYVSSHPEIAALVWGSVKLTFLVCEASLRACSSLLTSSNCKRFWQTSPRILRSLRSFSEASISYARALPSIGCCFPTPPD